MASFGEGLVSTELTDQAAHAAACIVALTPAALFPNPFTFAWAGWCLGLIREVTEEGDPVTTAKVIKAAQSWRDLITWTATGFLIGVIA
jgi:hypothetical protein